MGTIKRAIDAGKEAIEGGSEPYSYDNPGNAADVIDDLVDIIPIGRVLPDSWSENAVKNARGLSTVDDLERLEREMNGDPAGLPDPEDAPPSEPPPPPPPPPAPPEPPRDPLAIDLNRDGVVSTLNKDQGVHFDLDNSGFAESTSWVASGDGLLVLDRNGNGRIDGGAELFGTDTTLANGKFAANGFAALGDFDSNADGIVSADDEVYDSLRVWVDSNSDGVSTAEELHGLSEVGIASIALQHSVAPVRDKNGVEHREFGQVTYADNSVGLVNTLWFNTDKTNSVPVEIHTGDGIALPADILALPDAVGYGNTYSLHQAMALDTSGELKALVASFVAQESAGERKELVSQILFLWTKQNEVAPDSRGGKIDARKLGVLESFWGFSALQAKPTGAYAVSLATVYQQLESSVYSQLMLGGQAAADIALVKFTTTAGKVTADFSYLSASYALRISQGDATAANELADIIDVVAGINPYDATLKNQFIASLETTATHLNAVDKHTLLQVVRAGSDTVTGTADADIIRGYAGNDLLRGGLGDDLLHGNQGNDTLYGGGGNDFLLGNEGDNTLYGEAGDDKLFGGAGRDTLYGGDGADLLIAGSGLNVLSGQAGDDMLVAGEGQSSLEGGAGNDLYIFSEGHGNTVINNYDTGAASVDRLMIEDYALAELALTRINDDLVITVRATNKTVTLKSYFQTDATGAYALDEIGLAKDGTVLDVAAVKSLVQVGSEGVDRLYGYAGADTLSGLAGNDTISGYGGNDIVDGGDGNDSLNGDTGNDTVIGGLGADNLKGGTGTDLLLGGDGNDVLAGEAGNDVLEGGVGNDALDGGADSDIYRFNRGWGQDTISSYDTSANRVDAIVFGADIAASDIQVSRSGNQLILTLTGTTDRVVVNEFFQSDATTGYRVDEVRFADGTVWTIGQIKTMVLPSTTGNDVIIGYGTDDVLTGNLGNDTISGSGGNDLVDGEDGNDSINGDSGNDTVIGGLGTDTLKGGTGNDLLLGGDGNDVLAGEAGDDILEGGVGNDALDGGAGSDIYRFNRGWGQDTISSYDTSANRVDAILFGADIAASDIQVSRSGNQLILTLTGTTDRIVVNEYFQSDATTGYRVDEVRFADGTVWTIGQIKTMVLPSTAGNDVIIGYGTDDALAGGLGNDTISGYGGNDIVDGGDGNDSLSGDSGNDTVIGSLGADNLKGGTGNDLLLGGDGNDVLAGEAGSDVLEGGVGNDALDGGADSDIYRFNRGWGQDTISSYDTSANRVDAIVFGADIAASDIQVSRSGNQLILTLTGTTDRVVVNEFFQSDATTGYRVDEVRFADGTVWTIGQIKTMVLPSTTGNDVIIGYGTDDVLTGNLGNDTISGSAGNDFLDGEDGNDSLNGDSGNDTVIGGLGTDNLKGGTGNDLLLGGDGNDVLAGEAGDDILEGGVGNDALDGGAGSDIYRFNRGWGQDTISSYDTSANRVDAIVFGADVAASDIQASRSGNQLILTLTGTTDRIVVNEFFQSDATTGYRVDEVRFADGTVWNIAQIKTMVLPGTAGNDVISGYGSDDVLSGSHGNDTMSGFAGNDVIQGEEGNDSLKGGAGHDLLLGGDGTDLLAGEAGNDTLEGGAGNDALEGGADSDLYRFSRGWGQDTINNNDSGTGKVDAIEFAGDIAPGEVNITRSGTNLVLSLAGSADKITVTGYFTADGASSYKLEEVRFADGTVWSVAKVKELALQSTAGADVLTGYATDDVLTGGAGNDFLAGEGGNDTLSGGAGNDTLNGGAGNNTYLYRKGDGSDTISGFANSTAGKNNVLVFSDGIVPDEVALQRSGTALVVSFAGSSDKITLADVFYSSATGNSSGPVQTLQFENGTVWSITAGGSVTNILNGQAGRDIIVVADTSKNNVLAGGAGDDVLFGGSYADTYLFNLGDGKDTLVETATYGSITDVLRFGEGISAGDLEVRKVGVDLLLVHSNGRDQVTLKNWFNGTGATANVVDASRIERIEFADGSSWDAAVIQNQIVTRGSELADSLSGWVGNDFIHAGAGDDVIDGGTGINHLFGEAGNDTLKVAATAKDSLLVGGLGNDTLLGSSYNDTYVFNLGDGKDTIVEAATYSSVVDVLSFGAGIAASDIQVVRVGTDLLLAHSNGNDQVTIKNWFNSVTSSADVVDASRIERVTFADGTSWGVTELQSQILVLGTEQADTLAGWVGNDFIHAGAGNDVVDGGTGTNHLFGNAGNDTLKVAATAKDNLLVGGLGDDTLQGSSYNDTYVFNLGDGRDTIVEAATYSSVVDVLNFGAGIAASDIQVVRVGTDLLLVHSNGSDQVTIKNWFNGTTSLANVVDASRIERVAFADGTIWGVNELQSQILVLGTEQADTLAGWVGNDFIHAGAGNDVVDGGTGTNHLFGNVGNDILKVAATAKDNLLVGGLGDDTLQGSSYNDTYVFNLGDGKDTIVEAATYSGAVDVLSFGAGIAAGDIQVVRVGTDLLLVHGNGSDQVTIKNWFGSAAVTANVVDASRIERIAFADGTNWGVNELQSQILVLGTEQADTLAGWVGNDFIHAGAGDDVIDGGTGTNQLFGDAGNDTLKVATTSRDNLLVGGTGNDTLVGSSYNDTYLFNQGDGQDSIVETATYTGVTDVLRFGEGIDSNDLWFTRNGADLDIAVTGSQDKVSIKNWYASAANHVERFETSNGATLLDSQVQNLVNAMASFSASAPAESGPSADARTQLEVVIAANWQ